MSRIGKMPVSIPEGVKVTLEEEGGRLTVSGPKGEQRIDLPPGLDVSVVDGSVEVACPSGDRFHRSLWGLTRSLIANAVEGANRGFEKRLEIEGVGYRADLEGRDLRLTVGFSHPVRFVPPEGISFVVENPMAQRDTPARILVQGVDKQKVGEMAAKIRAIRPPEPYQGKGIRYRNEYIRRKAGKSVGT